MDKLTKILSFALVLLLLLTVAFPSSLVSAASGTSFTKTTYKTTDSLNLRSSNTTTSKKLTTIPKNTQISSSYRKGSWYKLSYQGKTGYVLGTYLKKVATGTSFAKTTYQTTAALSLRKAATTSSTRLLTIPTGKKISSSYKDGNWYKVTYSNKTGYVSGSYLKKVTASTTSKTTAYTTTERLNLRTAPSASGKLILTIPKAHVVQSLSTSGAWHKVTYNGSTGYVIGTYLKKGTSSPASSSTASVDYSGSKMYVLISSGSTVTLRSGPSSSSSQLARLGRGTPVVVSNSTHKTRGYVAVKTADGRSGYVESMYLTLFQPAPSNRPLIVLDPGHGGYDPGATRVGLTERDIVLAVARQVASLLEGKVDLQLTRYTNDYYPTLTDRSVMANSHATARFVSIHINASNATSASGAENYYYNGSTSIQLANAIQQRLVSYAGMRNRGVDFGNLAVIRGTNAPAVLTELGFLSNSTDRSKLTNAAYQARYAQAIADGILATL